MMTFFKLIAQAGVWERSRAKPASATVNPR
jgi:hypothetical protein